MKFVLLSLLVLLTSCQSKNESRIRIEIPSASMEAAYIWNTIQNIRFFEENNYQLSLPKGALIEELKEKVRQGSASITNDDYTKLKQFVIDSVYEKSAYQQGYQKIEDEAMLISQMINEIDTSGFSWDFKKFSTYKITLTLYGPGGSYNSVEGSILIYTTPEGQFKSYSNPANTIIHEVTHIGMEKSIMERYQVPHAMKERIVDLFVSLHFGKYLPDYKIQEMGDRRVDESLTKLASFKDLDKIITQILD